MVSCRDLSHSDFETNCSKWVTGTAVWSQPVDISVKQARLKWRLEKLALRVRHSLSAKESVQEEMRRAVPFPLLIGCSLRSAQKCEGSCVCVALLWSSTAPHAALLPATLEQLSQERESGLPCRNTAKRTIIPLALGDLLTSLSFMHKRE